MMNVIISNPCTWEGSIIIILIQAKFKKCQREREREREMISVMFVNAVLLGDLYKLH